MANAVRQRPGDGRIKAPIGNSAVRVRALEVLLFQFAGVAFILFYYAEVVIEIRRDLFFGTSYSYEIDSVLLWFYHKANSAQSFLGGYYAELLIAVAISILSIYCVLLLTWMRHGDWVVMLRGCAYLALGLLAIPIVLIVWESRWMPSFALDLFLSVASSIRELLSPMASIISWVFGWIFTIGAVILALFFAIMLVVNFRIIRLVGIILACALLLLLIFVQSFESFVESGQAALIQTQSFFSKPFEFVLNSLSWLGSFIGLIFTSILAICVFATIFSQFGHMMLDTLFDARNVSKNARAAGRFLVGIGFLISTILLCIPENALARSGAIEAVNIAVTYFEIPWSYQRSVEMIEVLSERYALLIPDSIQSQTFIAFSYGAPPSLELILTLVACLIAFFLISIQLMSDNPNFRVPIAFAPRELLLLFWSAILVVAVVFFASEE